MPRPHCIFPRLGDKQTEVHVGSDLVRRMSVHIFNDTLGCNWSLPKSTWPLKQRAYDAQLGWELSDSARTSDCPSPGPSTRLPRFEMRVPKLRKMANQAPGQAGKTVVQVDASLKLAGRVAGSFRSQAPDFSAFRPARL